MAFFNRAKGLTGLNPLAYMGQEGAEGGNTTVPLVCYPDDPTPTDWQNFNLMTLWLNTSNNNLWYLASLAGNQALWLMLSGGSGDILKLTGDTGGPVFPLGGNINVVTDVAALNAGSTVSIVGNPGSHTLTLNITDALLNTIVGKGAGNATITGNLNTGLGRNALAALTSGVDNVALGFFSMLHANTASNNVFVGLQSGVALTSSTNCVGVGINSLSSLLTGSNNIGLGANSGSNYTGAESSNICIGNSGTLGESNIIHIGTQGNGSGQQNAAYMAGIYNVAVGATNALVIIDNTGKLGTNGSLTSSSFFGTGGGTQNLAITNSTSWIAPYGTIVATKANGQLICPLSGVISNLNVYIWSNFSTTNITVTLNINGVNTGLVTTVTALTTGSFSSAGGTVNVTAGDLIQFEIQAATTNIMTGTISAKFTG